MLPSKLAPWYDYASLQSAFGRHTLLSPVGTVSPLFQIPFPIPQTLLGSRLWVKWVHLFYTEAHISNTPPCTHLSGHSLKEPHHHWCVLWTCTHIREMWDVLFSSVCGTCSLTEPALSWLLLFSLWVTVTNLIQIKQQSSGLSCSPLCRHRVCLERWYNQACATLTALSVLHHNPDSICSVGLYLVPRSAANVHQSERIFTTCTANDKSN